MKKDLLKIIQKYGVLYQLEYYQTEVWELNDAIQEYEYTDRYGIEELENHLKEHIAEELSDNFVMLYQFKEYYKLDFELVKDFITFERDPLRYLKIFFKDVHRLSRKIIEIEALGETMVYDKDELSNLLKLVLYELKQFQAYYGITDEEIEKPKSYEDFESIDDYIEHLRDKIIELTDVINKLKKENK